MIAKKKKLLYVTGAILAAFLVLSALYLLNKPDKINHEVSVDDDSMSPWLWENPYTYRKISIPGDWQVARTAELQETTLALSHKTGRSLVYIIYESSVDSLSLPEYVDAMNAANRKELGTAEFELRRNEYGEDIYYSGGARYFDDNMAVTRVRIWSNEENHFWRSTAVTEGEYKELEYDAEKLMDLLFDSTRQDM